MTERRLTFIDCDENPLEVLLKEDRVQLVVVDSRPELEAGELRRFASVLFATYAGPPLIERLASACTKLGEVRDQLASAAGENALVAALDASLATVEDLKQALTAATTVASDPASAEPPEPPEPAEPPGPPEPPEPPMGSILTAYDRFKTPKRARRAQEGDGLLVWGWVRHRGSMIEPGAPGGPGVPHAPGRHSSW